MFKDVLVFLCSYVVGGVVVRVDPRELILKKINSINTAQWQSVYYLYMETINFLCFFDEKDADAAFLKKTVNDFMGLFETEKGRQSFFYILYGLDCMLANGKGHPRGVFKVPTRHRKIKYKYPEMVEMVIRIRETIYEVIRSRSRDIRITDPNIYAV